jgi:hypothetical protein
MCYYDNTRWSCGFWKWGNFRMQCPKEYRTGETCGQKLIHYTEMLDHQCKVCDQIEKKNRRWTKMYDDVARWRNEGNRRATIEKTEREIVEVQWQIYQLQIEHENRLKNVDY